MKTEKNTVLLATQAELHAKLDAVKKARAAYAECIADSEALQVRITKLGTPSYKNEKAVQELLMLKQKLTLCNAEAESHDTLISETAGELRLFLAINKPQVVDALLLPMYERRLETVTAVFLPFSNSPERARSLAEKTDVCVQGLWAIQAVNSNDDTRSPTEVLAHAAVVDKILEEGLKSDGDIVQFLDPQTLARLSVEFAQVF